MTIAAAGGQLNLHTLGLALDWLGIDVILGIGGGASIEGGRSVGIDLSIATDGEPSGWGSTLVTLELFGWRGKDTATPLGVGNLAIADRVTSGRQVSSNTVLAIRQLSNAVLAVRQLTNSS